MSASSIIQWFVSTIIVGGVLWKGLDSISNALAKRSEHENTMRRLDFEQMQANYDNAMTLIDKQAARIDTLHDDIEINEKRKQEDQAAYIKRINELKLSFINEIDELKTELSAVKREYDSLMQKNRKLELDYEEALKRIERLEKGKTGPLKKE